jgi:hypothetical protein
MPYWEETPTVPPPPPPPEPPPFPDGAVHRDTAGEIVYVACPVDCERTMLATPELQVSDAAPPPLDDAAVRSYEGDWSVNVPPVEDESVTTTLVAFTVTASAAEPAVIVKFVEGVESDTVVLFV